MGKKLTKEEFKERVFQCVGDKYSVKGEYQGKTKPVLMHCDVHDVDFTVTAECYMRGRKDVRGSCPECHEELMNEKFKDNRTDVECAYCGKSFVKSNSTLLNSQSGMYFCCREHKDLAQRLESGKQFDYLRPSHYGVEQSTQYRALAFRSYPHQCAICGYHDDDDISLLDVHHIDSDRENNDLDNLIILCPNCHRKLTLKKYILVDRNQIIKNDSLE